MTKHKLYTNQEVFIKETEDFPEEFTGMIEAENGDKVWMEVGKWHRKEGPAVITHLGVEMCYLYGIPLDMGTHALVVGHLTKID
jgi:hypothetical protein